MALELWYGRNIDQDDLLLGRRDRKEAGRAGSTLERLEIRSASACDPSSDETRSARGRRRHSGAGRASAVVEHEHGLGPEMGEEDPRRTTCLVEAPRVKVANDPP